MSELAYLLPLTERERDFLREAVRIAEETAEGNVLRTIAAGRSDERKKAQRFEEAYRALARKLRALEPIGTGGTTEGA